MSRLANERQQRPSPASSDEVPAAFPKFLQLPPELQTQIWEETLPSNIRHAALYSWRPGCWGPAFKTDTDPDYRTPRDGDLNLLLQFFHDRLGYTQLNLPAASANAEAHGIAVAWAAEQGVEVRGSANGEGSVFFRPFHPEIDILYVSPGDWDNFIREPMELPFKLDLFHDQFFKPRTAVCRIAVSEASLRQPFKLGGTLPDEDSLLRELELAHPTVGSLYIVTGPQPDAPVGTSLPVRLEVEKAQGWELVWVAGDRGVQQRDSFIRAIRTSHRLDEGLHKRLAELSEGLHEGYMKYIPKARPGTRASHKFEIRIVHVVKVGGYFGCIGPRQ